MKLMAKSVCEKLRTIDYDYKSLYPTTESIPNYATVSLTKNK